MDSEPLKVVNERFDLFLCPAAKDHQVATVVFAAAMETFGEKQQRGVPKTTANQTGRLIIVDLKPPAKWAKNVKYLVELAMCEDISSPPDVLKINLDLAAAAGLMQGKRPPQQRVSSGSGLDHHELARLGRLGDQWGMHGQANIVG
jgi:hypothetical protein